MAEKERSEPHAFGIDLILNRVYMSDGDIIPITHIIGRNVVAGPLLSGEWVCAELQDEEYADIDAWRARYGEREN